MNDFSGDDNSSNRLSDLVPASVRCILCLLFLAGIAVSLFILVVVHNALLLAAVILLSALVVAFFLWNSLSFKRNLAIFLFIDRFPDSDLLTASEGQLVKITGQASCGELSLESSYEKVGRCIYTSALLYEYSRFGFEILNVVNRPNIPKTAKADDKYCCWKLTYSERFTADFYVIDAKSGTRALVKAGYDSRVMPLVTENLIVNTTNKNREVSSTLKRWLEERSLSTEARLLRLKEGYIEEGTSITVVGALNKRNGNLVIVPPPEVRSTRCLFQKLLLPVSINGLILRVCSRTC